MYAHVWAGEYWREGDWQALDTHTNDTSFLDLALQVCVCVCVCVCVRARAGRAGARAGAREYGDEIVTLHGHVVTHFVMHVIYNTRFTTQSEADGTAAGYTHQTSPPMKVDHRTGRTK